LFGALSFQGHFQGVFRGFDIFEIPSLLENRVFRKSSSSVNCIIEDIELFEESSYLGNRFFGESSFSVNYWYNLISCKVRSHSKSLKNQATDLTKPVLNSISVQILIALTFWIKSIFRLNVIFSKFIVLFSDSLASIDDQRDYFVFKVTDGYNDLIDRKFFINIEAGDKMYPMVFNEALELPEDGRRILTTTLLKASGEFLNWWFSAKSYWLEKERSSLVDLRLKGVPVIN